MYRTDLAVALVCAALLSGCAQFPVLDETATPGVNTAAYPDLLPLDGLTFEPPARATPEARADIEARAARLRSRALALQSASVGANRGLERRMQRLQQRANQLRAGS